MKIDIRKSVMQNLKDMTEIALEDTIIDAINTEKDVTLPGLGVLFEKLWKSSNEKDKKYIINIISKNI